MLHYSCVGTESEGKILSDRDMPQASGLKQPIQFTIAQETCPRRVFFCNGIAIHWVSFLYHTDLDVGRSAIASLQNSNTLIQSPGQEATAARLCVLAIIIALCSLIASEWLARRTKQRLQERDVH